MRVKEHRNIIVFKDETIVPVLRNISSSVRVSPLNSARQLLSKETKLPLSSQTNISEINTEAYHPTTNTVKSSLGSGGNSSTRRDLIKSGK